MKTTRSLAFALVFAAGCATAPGPRPTGSSAPPPPPSAGRAASSAPAGTPAATDGLPARTQRLFDEAVQALEDQRRLKVPVDWALLERKWRAVLGASELAEARFNLAVALEREGRIDEARAEYAKALADKPSLRQAAVNLVVLKEKQGDVRGAAEAYGALLREFPEDAVARERLAALYQSAGQLDEAWRLAREALLRDPRSIGAYKVMIRVSIQRGNLDLAKLVALRAQKLDEADPELPWLAGQIAGKQGDDAAAAVQYRRALQLKDGFLPARYALLDGALRKQRWGVAAEQAQAILKQEPNNAPVRLVLGIAQRHLGKTDEALASYAEAEKLGGDRLPEVHLARGVLLMRVKNECEPAIEELKAYQRTAGPVLPAESPVPKLLRECEEIVAQNRQAAEAARQMQAEAQRKAAEQAAKKPAPEKGAPEKGGSGGGGGPPTSAAPTTR